jgi:hypothetical protein
MNTQHQYRGGQAMTDASLSARALTPLAESPISVYLAGVSIGIGCGALCLLLLIGELSV